MFRFLYASFSAASLHNVLTVFIRTIQNEFDLTFPPPRCFGFCIPFSSFLLFSFTGPIGASFTCVCSKNSADSVDCSRRVLDVSNMCGGGEFDGGEFGGGEFGGCEGLIRPFIDDTLECGSESIMLQKTHKARAGGN